MKLLIRRSAQLGQALAVESSELPKPFAHAVAGGSPLLSTLFDDSRVSCDDLANNPLGAHPSRMEVGQALETAKVDVALIATSSRCSTGAGWRANLPSIGDAPAEESREVRAAPSVHKVFGDDSEIEILGLVPAVRETSWCGVFRGVCHTQ